MAAGPDSASPLASVAADATEVMAADITARGIARHDIAVRDITVRRRLCIGRFMSRRRPRSFTRRHLLRFITIPRRPAIRPAATSPQTTIIDTDFGAEKLNHCGRATSARAGSPVFYFRGLRLAMMSSLGFVDFPPSSIMFGPTL
jgi:hypothetical protein